MLTTDGLTDPTRSLMTEVGASCAAVGQIPAAKSGKQKTRIVRHLNASESDSHEGELVIGSSIVLMRVCLVVKPFPLVFFLACTRKAGILPPRAQILNA